jgi:hypothetical protein
MLQNCAKLRWRLCEFVNRNDCALKPGNRRSIPVNIWFKKTNEVNWVSLRGSYGQYDSPDMVEAEGFSTAISTGPIILELPTGYREIFSRSRTEVGTLARTNMRSAS